MTTDSTVKQLARAFQVDKKHISYSGKKDRRAITSQWFGIHLPGKPSDIPDQIHENLKVLKFSRHNKKLRRGAHKANRFTLALRNLEHFDEQRFKNQLEEIAMHGYPNYFGPQRFGINENNVEFASAMMESKKRLKRQERDRVYSTLRALDFNYFLSSRVAAQSWLQYQPGDLLQLSGSSSYFATEQWDEELEQRLKSGDIAIAGILPGKGSLQSPLAVGKIYQSPQILADYLAGQRVEQGTRALRVCPKDLAYELHQDSLILNFSLPKGAYATSLLREILATND